MGRIEGRVALVAGAMLAMALVAASHAERKTVVSIKGAQGYFSSNYSDGDNIDKAEAPNVKAMGRFDLYAWKEPVMVKGVVIDPVISFEWRAVDWPIGGESSSINENNYLPEIKVLVNENEEGRFRGLGGGWHHQSTGTGDSTTTNANSGALDRGEVDTYWAFLDDAIKVRVTGWYTFSVSPDGVRDFMNFDFWDSVGGEIAVTGTVDFVRVVATLGLDSQDVMAFFPLREPWNFEVFAQLHNGELDGLLDYADAHTSGGLGLAIGLGDTKY